MWGTKSEQGVDVQVGTPLYDSSCDQATLRDAHDVDLLASEVWIVMQLVADRGSLPLHTLKHGSDFAITDLDAFDDSLVVDGLGDHVRPACLWASPIDSM